MPSALKIAGGSDRLLTPDEVAEWLRVSRMTVYRLIRAGQLRALRLGKNYRIPRSWVRQYLETRKVKRPIASKSP